MEEELDYRPITTSLYRKEEKKEKTSKDEVDISTLVEVDRKLDNALYNMFKDFNSFDLISEGSENATAKNLLYQVKSRQMAFEIIKPLSEEIKQAIINVKSKYGRE